MPDITTEQWRDLNLVWGDSVRSGESHLEWHAPCGCAYHPEGDQGPHVHPCEDHDTGRDARIAALEEELALLKGCIEELEAGFDDNGVSNA